MSIFLTLLMKDKMQKMLFSMVIFIKSILLNLLRLKEVNMETVVISNMNLLNIEVTVVTFLQKIIVLSNVIIFQLVVILYNNV